MALLNAGVGGDEQKVFSGFQRGMMSSAATHTHIPRTADCTLSPTGMCNSFRAPCFENAKTSTD